MTQEPLLDYLVRRFLFGAALGLGLLAAGVLVMVIVP